MTIVIGLHFSFLLFATLYSTFVILHESSSFYNACGPFASFSSSLLVYIFLLPVPNPVDRACVLRSCLSWSQTSPEKETLQSIPLAGGGGSSKFVMFVYMCTCVWPWRISLQCVWQCVFFGLRKYKSVLWPRQTRSYFILCFFVLTWADKILSYFILCEFVILFYFIFCVCEQGPTGSRYPTFFSSTWPVPTRKLKMTGYRVIRFHPANWMNHST